MPGFPPNHAQPKNVLSSICVTLYDSPYSPSPYTSAYSTLHMGYEHGQKTLFFSHTSPTHIRQCFHYIVPVYVIAFIIVFVIFTCDHGVSAHSAVRMIEIPKGAPPPLSTAVIAENMKLYGTYAYLILR